MSILVPHRYLSFYYDYDEIGISLSIMIMIRIYAVNQYTNEWVAKEWVRPASSGFELIVRSVIPSFELSSQKL